jgi:hypothetical protein
MKRPMKRNSMKNTIRTVVAGLLLVAHAAVANGEYTETMDPNGLLRNLKMDFGLVDDDGVTAKSSGYAVTIGLGGVKKQELARNPNAKNGRFADGSSIKNVHAIFGTTAQIKTHAMMGARAQEVEVRQRNL